MRRRITFCVLGCAQDTGNLGVSALGSATIQNLIKYFPGCRILLQQQSSEPQVLSFLCQGNPVQVETLFLHSSERIRERCGTKFIKTLCFLYNSLPKKLFYTIAKRFKPLQQLLQADVVFDISGGDSFATIYGDNVFRAQVSFKQIPLLLEKPLVLLPQTFGPFDGLPVRNIVASIYDKCCGVATRDLGGIEEIQEIINGEMGIHYIQCPDVAFSLESIPVTLENEPFFQANIDYPIVGLNVSGLLYLNRKDFGIMADYNVLINNIIDWVLNELNGSVLLVPHVVRTPKMGTEGTSMEYSDSYACQKVINELKVQNIHHERVGMLSGNYSAGEIKYLIGKCDFFIGSRMHACIAATSQKIPTVALAYSKKFAGVFGLAGIPEVVVDLRKQSTDSCLANISGLYLRRITNQPHFSTQIDLTQQLVKNYFKKYLPLRLASNSNLAEFFPEGIHLN